jgi:hypothetical protein
MTMCETMGASHAFLEQPGELRLLLRGRSLPELLTEGGCALGDRLCGQAKRGPSGPWVELDIHATGQQAILGNWLNRLLDLAERDRWAPVECQLLALSNDGVRARVRGVPLGETPRIGRAVVPSKFSSAPGGRGLQVEVILQPRAKASSHPTKLRKHAAVTRGR